MTTLSPSARSSTTSIIEDDRLVLVSCQRVSHSYGRGHALVVAVREVTCEVEPRARIALTGPSGSGKSTLLHLMAGLEEPTAGRVGWPGLGGHPLMHPGRVGVVFQGPSLLPGLNAVENVSFPLHLAGVSDQEATQRGVDALRRLGIDDLAGALPQELSGGQAQRVAVARVLAARPALILADEPTGQLDHGAAAVVMDVLLQAADELDAAVVVSTHDPAVASRLPGRWWMRDGHLEGTDRQARFDTPTEAVRP